MCWNTEREWATRFWTPTRHPLRAVGRVVAAGTNCTQNNICGDCVHRAWFIAAASRPGYHGNAFKVSLWCRPAQKCRHVLALSVCRLIIRIIVIMDLTKVPGAINHLRYWNRKKDTDMQEGMGDTPAGFEPASTLTNPGSPCVSPRPPPPLTALAQASFFPCSWPWWNDPPSSPPDWFALWYGLKQWQPLHINKHECIHAFSYNKVVRH